jgi:hypothetical protein
MNIDAKSGECVVAAVYEIFYAAGRIRSVTVKEIEDVDRDEKF